MPNGPLTSLAFDAGFYVESNADTPDMLEVALDKNDYRAGDTMTVAVTARSAGRLTLNVFGDRLLATQHAATCKPGAVQVKMPVGTRLGHRRLCGRDPAPAARRAGAAHAGPLHRRAVGSRSTARRRRSPSSSRRRR